MSSIIEELQSDCIHSDANVEEILTKSFLVAKKLNLEEFEKWINFELEGYEIDNIPEYRTIKGKLKAETGMSETYISMQNSEEQKKFENRRYEAPISKIEYLYNHNNNNLKLYFNAETTNYIQLVISRPVVPFLSFDSSELKKILSLIKKTILNWILKLESDGIHGEGISFSDDEKKIANEKKNEYTLIIFQQINIKMSQDETFRKLDEIEQLIKNSNEITDTKTKEYSEDLEIIKSELKNEIPNKDKIKDIFTNFLIGTSGSLLANNIQPIIYMLCFSLGINI